MAAERIPVFAPNDEYFRGVPVLEELFMNNFQPVTVDDLEKNSIAGKDLEVALISSISAKALMQEIEKGTLPSLKVIINHGVGVSHLPLQKLKDIGIRLTNTPAVLSDTTADLAFALMLASARKLLTGVYACLYLPTRM